MDYDAISAGRAHLLGRLLRSVEEDQGSFGEVAAVAHLPFVVGLDQDRSGQPEQGGGVGEDADDVGAPLDLLVKPLQQRVGRPDLLPVA